MWDRRVPDRRSRVDRRSSALDPDQKKHLRFDALSGNEIVDNTARLCVMNLLLHGIGQPNGESPIKVEDSLTSDPGDRYSMVLTNPPFGKKPSMTIVVDGEASREGDTDNLPPPAVIAAEIAEDLEAALAEFAEIAASLSDQESG